jgi:cell filamentation protein, protein adenylyltransferase
MKSLLKNGRESKGYTTRQVSELLRIDQALISKFENGLRMPTKKQIRQFSDLFEIDYETLAIAWLKEKILHEIGDSEFGLKALKAAEEVLGGEKNPTEEMLPAQFQKLMHEMESLKSMLSPGKKTNS